LRSSGVNSARRSEDAIEPRLWLRSGAPECRLPYDRGARRDAVPARVFRQRAGHRLVPSDGSAHPPPSVCDGFGQPIVIGRARALLFPQVLTKVPMHINIRCIYAYINTREANDGNEASDYGRHWGNWWRGRAALAARGCFRARSGAPRG